MTERKKKVLVVDDDMVVLDVVQAQLEDLGYDVIIHDHALGTTQLLMEHKPDVLLLDMNMPVLSGPQLLDVLRGRLGETTVILHTANQSDNINHWLIG